VSPLRAIIAHAAIIVSLASLHSRRRVPHVGSPTFAKAGLAATSHSTLTTGSTDFTNVAVGVPANATSAPVGRNIGFRATINNRHVMSDPSDASRLKANVAPVGAWEQFDVVNAGGAGPVALRSRVSGRYVTADQGAGANRSASSRHGDRHRRLGAVRMGRSGRRADRVARRGQRPVRRVRPER
jgi:hypothetical protein